MDSVAIKSMWGLKDDLIPVEKSAHLGLGTRVWFPRRAAAAVVEGRCAVRKIDGLCSFSLAQRSNSWCKTDIGRTATCFGGGTCWYEGVQRRGRYGVMSL